MSELVETSTKAEPRSTRRRRLRPIRLLVILLAIVAVGFGGYALFWRYHLKRFDTVRPGVLYRSAQPTEFGMRHLAERHGIKTVLNTRRFRWRLKEGAVTDPGEANGDFEDDYVKSLGLDYEQWPLGDEPYWPWPTPWYFEELFKLYDDPARHPIVVHCLGGRHRTGTTVALFRLEYDRWPVERVLEEMYSFSFGPPVPLQDLNLRTYWPRPRPNSEAWTSISSNFASFLDPEKEANVSEANYAALIRRLRTHRGDEDLEAALSRYLRERQPFALCLVARLVDTPDDPLAPQFAECAAACLADDDEAPFDDWATAAAAVADFGTSEQQQEILEMLREEDYTQPPSPKYQALVAGVTNRYTPNRVAYLRPLLDDERKRPEPAARMYRYCDTGVARLSVIAYQNFVAYSGPNGGAQWDCGREAALAWFAEHPRREEPGPLAPPEGKNRVRPNGESGGKLPPGES